MIVGAAVIPTAPLLVPGVSANWPDGVAKVVDAVQAATAGLPDADVAVLLAAGERGVYDAAEASMAGVGRPDITAGRKVCRSAIVRISAAAQYRMRRGDPLPLGLAALALLIDDRTATVPVAVPANARFDALVGIGAGIARATADAHLRAVVIAAGDLSAGLTESSPLYRIDGALFWDEQIVAVFDSGRLDGLRRLGPQEAGRVGAPGWAPLVVLHGAVARAKLGMVVRHYSAPRGVGYLVAAGA